MGFVPVNFRLGDGSINKLNDGVSFAFSPPGGPIYSSQASKFADRRADRKRFDIGDFTDECKIHDIGSVVLNSTRIPTRVKEMDNA